MSWAKLVRKVFEVDPLRCPRCGGSMAVIAWITDPATVDPESWPIVGDMVRHGRPIDMRRERIGELGGRASGDGAD